jgi:hypothetical protein
VIGRGARDGSVLLGAGLALALGAGCTIGDSAASKASLEIGEGLVVADGVSTVQITVKGEADTRITLVVDGDGASFVDPDPGLPTEKSIYLLDDGQAMAEVVSTESGKIAVAVKGERSRTTELVEFEPVRIAAGMPGPVGFAPGVTVHDVCFAVNSPHGHVMASRLEGIGSFTGESKAVEDEEPSGKGCPSATVDEVGWLGWVVFQWGSATGTGKVTLDYYDTAVDSALPGLDAGVPEDEPDASWDFFDKAAPIASETLELAGESFPGYEVVAEEPELGTYASVALDLAYLDRGDLDGGPAGAVRLRDIHTVPELPLVGSSTTGDLANIKTGIDGHVILFFDYYDADPGEYELFVTPEGGATVHVTDIVIDDFGDF